MAIATHTLDLNQPFGAIRPKRSRRRVFTLALFAVFLFGLALMGWSAWSANQAPPRAWQSTPAYERMYLTWLADKYWITSDTAMAQKELAGVDRAYLTELLAAMQHETKDPKTRQHLAALAEVLKLPASESSVMPLLVKQPAFLLAIFLAVAPLLGALGITVAPFLRRRQSPAELALAELTQLAPASETQAIVDEILAEQQAQTPMELPPLSAKPLGEGEADEATEDEPEHSEGDQPEEGDGGLLGDLASLFEVEDTTLAALEALGKGLAEIKVEDLAKSAADVASRFKAVGHSPNGAPAGG
ncbi:MAG: hypothetical protein HY327_06310 [Chloroflexi bacterium]|nr:hypothetical protein [Chloroflexota bacterium]